MGLAVLFAHELDAITQKEWQLLFILRRMPEAQAKPLFVLLHIPLISILLWMLNHESSFIVKGTEGAIALFLIIHAGLHRRLTHHPKYTFHTVLSKSLIYGGGLLGLGYIILVI